MPGESIRVEGVDPQLVKPFAKICRVVGLVLVVLAAIWVNTYEWSYRHTPMQALASEAGYWGKEAEVAGIFWTLFLLVLGWFLRFRIGRLFVGAVFIAIDFGKGLARRI